MVNKICMPMLSNNSNNTNGKRKNKKKAKVPNPLNVVPVSFQAGGARRGYSERYSSASVSDGSLIYRNSEYWFDVVGSSTTQFINKIFQPGSSGLYRLDAVASTFETYRVKRLKVHFYTASSTNNSGMIHMGIDFDPADLPTSVAGIANLNPRLICPVYQTKDTTIPVPISSINKCTPKGWMYTKAGPAIHQDLGPAFALCVACTTSGIDQYVGEVFCEYEVELKGPTSPVEVTQSITYNNVYVSDVSTAGIISGTSERDSTSIVGSITAGTPNALELAIANRPSPVAADWATIQVDFTGIPNTVYQLLVSAFSDVFAPNFLGIWDLIHGRAPLINVGQLLSSNGATANVLSQVITDANGVFSGVLSLNTDHFPGSVASLVIHAAAATMGLTPIITEYYSHVH